VLAPFCKGFLSLLRAWSLIIFPYGKIKKQKPKTFWSFSSPSSSLGLALILQFP